MSSPETQKTEHTRTAYKLSPLPLFQQHCQCYISLPRMFLTHQDWENLWEKQRKPKLPYLPTAVPMGSTYVCASPPPSPAQWCWGLVLMGLQGSTEWALQRRLSPLLGVGQMQTAQRRSRLVQISESMLSSSVNKQWVIGCHKGENEITKDV